MVSGGLARPARRRRSGRAGSGGTRARGFARRFARVRRFGGGRGRFRRGRFGFGRGRFGRRRFRFGRRFRRGFFGRRGFAAAAFGFVGGGSGEAQRQASEDRDHRKE